MDVRLTGLMLTLSPLNLILYQTIYGQLLRWAIVSDGHYLNFPGLRFRQLPLVTAFPPLTGHS